MHNDRFARALLRLYPRAWRQRYGDEFLALIADAGLSWREVVDVIGAAGVERVRAGVALVRSELDPTDPPVLATEGSSLDDFREVMLFVVLASLTVLALAIVGVPLPPWKWWPWLVFQPSALVIAQAKGNWRDRALLSYSWFIGVCCVTGFCWVVARVVSSLGVPSLSARVFFSLIGVFMLGFLLRSIYCGIRMLTYGSTWRGMHQHEFLGWRLGVLAVACATFNVDPAGEAFWAMAMIVGIFFRTPYELTRRGAARRRAQYEEAERFWTS